MLGIGSQATALVTTLKQAAELKIHKYACLQATLAACKQKTLLFGTAESTLQNKAKSTTAMLRYLTFQVIPFKAMRSFPWPFFFSCQLALQWPIVLM